MVAAVQPLASSVRPCHKQLRLLLTPTLGGHKFAWVCSHCQSQHLYQTPLDWLARCQMKQDQNLSYNFYRSVEVVQTAAIYNAF